MPCPELHARGCGPVRRTAALNHLDVFVLGGSAGHLYLSSHRRLGRGRHGRGDGTAVTGFRATGDGNPGISCGACEFCLDDEQPLCTSYGLLGEHVPGTAAEYLVVPGRNLARVPENMPWDQAAAFSLATLTAWRMLVGRARLRPGETVLIWGIGGGVAQACLRIAKLVGAVAIVTTAGCEASRGPRAGADHTVNHATGDVPKAVRAITGGRNADVVIDNVGEQTWQRSLRALGRGGRLVTCGGTTGPMVTTDVRKLFWYRWSILGSTMGSDREYQEVAALAGQARLWPVVDSVEPLSEGRALPWIPRIAVRQPIEGTT
jgi:NADPH:quinone reductase-like Zn-dependent oxidoreductase